MRVAGHTYAYRTRPLGEALDELKGIGFEDVEVWLGHVPEAPAQAAREVRERGLRAVAVSAGGFYEDRSAALPRALALAEALGVSNLVACVLPELLPAVAERISPGLRLCVENHWDQPLAKPTEIRLALDGVPGVCACLDTGHAIMAGVAPGRFAAELGPRLAHIHLKDARRPRAAERLLGRRVRRRLLQRPPPVFPGDGQLDLGHLAAVLAENRYDGTVTLEHEGLEPTRALGELLAAWESRHP